MSAINTSIKSSFSLETVIKFTKLYKEIGKGENNIKYLDKNHSLYKQKAINEEIIELFKFTNESYKITDFRFNQILNEKGSLVLKNKEEQLAKNLKQVFNRINGHNPFTFSAREISDLEEMLFKGFNQNEKGLKKHTSKEVSYYNKIELIITDYMNALKKKNVEYISLSIAFFIDFYYLSPFKSDNLLVGLILLYLLLNESEIRVFNYGSFFRLLRERKQEFMDSIKNSFFMYEENLTDISKTLSIILDISTMQYAEVERLYNDLIFDKQLKKNDIVEGIIMKLDEVFTKDDIRRALPETSLSTIDRTLKRMQEEGKISSFGRGRTAKWVRLVSTYNTNMLENI